MKLIVCGGGIGGSFIANAMVKHVDSVINYVDSVVLIEPKDYLEATPGVLGAIHSKDFKKDLESVLLTSSVVWDGRIEHIKARLSSVQPKENTIVLSDGQTLTYDLLCIATGSKPIDSGIWRPATTIATIHDRVSEIDRYRQELDMSDCVLILGAGVVGVEACCELAQRFPLKRFHLVASDPDILITCPAVMRKVAKRHLGRFRNVQIHYNTGKLTLPGENEILKIGSWEIRPDMVLKCFANGMNTDILPSEWLDKYKQVKVDKYLRVEGLDSVFVLGDVTNATPDKSAKAVMDQGIIVYESMKAFCAGVQPSQAFTKPRPGMVVKLGPYESMVYYNKFFGWYGLLFSGSYLATIVRLALLKRIVSFATNLSYFSKIGHDEQKRAFGEAPFVETGPPVDSD